MPEKRTHKSIIRPRLLRYWVCLQLQAAQEPMRIRDLVTLFDQTPYEVRGRTSKAISDTIRWATPRGWLHAMGRGMVRPGRIPESTQRYMRQKLEAAEAYGDSSWIKTQERKLHASLTTARVKSIAWRTGPYGICRYDAAPGGDDNSAQL
jgi:hypothetical protein